MVYFAYAIVWLASAGAICFAMHTLKAGWPLWFLLVPAFIRISGESKGRSCKGERADDED